MHGLAFEPTIYTCPEPTFKPNHDRRENSGCRIYSPLMPLYPSQLTLARYRARKAISCFERAKKLVSFLTQISSCFLYEKSITNVITTSAWTNPKFLKTHTIVRIRGAVESSRVSIQNN